MAPGSKMLRYPKHFGENVLLYGSHEWLPYSKDEVRLKTSNTNLSISVLCRYAVPLTPDRPRGIIGVEKGAAGRRLAPENYFFKRSNRILWQEGGYFFFAI